jgi:4-amino-4-deoxy-L-arabinose transferase-like glycosyltransferase
LDAHEVFVARTAVEMERRGDYLVPYYDSRPRLQKPPLSYWMTVLADRTITNEYAEQHEFHARAPSILLGAGTAAVIALLGWLVFDSLWIGVLASLFFATSHAFVDWSRSAQPEMAYTFGCALFVLGAAWARREAAAGRGTWGASLLAWTAMALAMLAKGPILPLALLVGAAIALRPRAGGRGLLRTLHVPAGLLWMLGLAAPFFLLVAWREPGAVEFWRAQMFDRTGGVSAAWWKPLEFFYVGQALGHWMPWSLVFLLLPWWLWRSRRAEGRGESTGSEAARASGARFLTWIAVVPCVMLSFSAGRKGYYLLPTFPAWAAAMAWAAVEAVSSWTAAKRTRALRLQAATCTLSLGVLCALVLGRREGLRLEGVEWMGVSVGLALALALGIAAGLTVRARPRLGAALLGACAICGAGAVGTSGVDTRQLQYASGEFARAVAARTSWDRPLLAVDGDVQTLLFYTDRPTTRLEPEQVDQALGSEPAPWIVVRESERLEHHIPGLVVLDEVVPAGEDPLQLVDPTQESSSSGAKAQSAPQGWPADKDGIGGRR